jgi:hypothetical protein
MVERIISKLFMGKEPDLQLKEGDKAPDFTAKTNAGGQISLSELNRLLKNSQFLNILFLFGFSWF